MAGENGIVVGYPSGNTLYATIRDTSLNVWYPTGQVFEAWGTGSRGHSSYAVSLTPQSGDIYSADWPSDIANGDYYLQAWIQTGASPSSSDIAFGGPTAKSWNGSTLVPTPTPGAPGTAQSCAEMVDEVQLRVGRPNATGKELVDVTWVTRRLNEAQRILAQKVQLIPSLTFKNVTSHDTTGTISYSLSDITIGDTTTDRPPLHIMDVWYIDGNQSKKLDFLPMDEFDERYPDPTHSDSYFGKPKHWTQRGNTAVEICPYCASAYWDKDLRFDGDFLPAEFTTDDSEVSDISQADEGLILYGVWKAWEAIGDTMMAVKAKKEWTNPHPSYGEDIGWLEKFRDEVEAMNGWESNFYG